MKIGLPCVVLSTLITVNCYAQKKSDLSEEKIGTPIYQMKPISVQSRWAKEVSPSNVLKEYPRPQLQRNNWQNLNGLWEYAIADTSLEKPSKFDGTILVPFPIESSLSGVQKTLTADKVLWYRRTLLMPSLKVDERMILNFGAVDWYSTVYINDKEVGKHTGGYQSFSYDITDFLKSGQNEILVKVYDPTDQGANPHGKQVLKPANIYYTSSSGIWQTVWLEKVFNDHVTRLKSAPDIDKGIVKIDITTTDVRTNLILEVTAMMNGKVVSSKTKPILSNLKKNQGMLTTSMTLDIPKARLWSPDDPFLYDLSIKLTKGKNTLDEVKSYFGMRKIDIQKDEKGADRIFLNNKYTYNLGVLDQGFWPEGLYTAPTDEALSFDIKAIKSLGFNTIRKHIKVEPERWYYHADKIGLLVWQDFVNPPQSLPEGSKPIFETEVNETIEQLYNHPCIITWVLFNERWGVYDQKRLTEWVKKLDPNRLINGHSGELLYVNNELRAPSDNPWISSDMTDVHSYPNPMIPPGQPNKARVLGEFGGVGVPVPGHEWDDTQGWGYIQVTSSELKDQYSRMMEQLKELERAGLSGSIYTQPFDVEGEENGLLTYDREIVKIPVNEIRLINKKMVEETNGFRLDPNFTIANNVNPNDNDGRYAELLDKYKKGDQDSALLRRLILMAFRSKDTINAKQISADYIMHLKYPYSNENIKFINKITNTSRDKGFEIFLKHSEKVDAVLGENNAIRKVKQIISAEEIEPYKTNNSKPDWDAIEQRVTTKYGSIGEELVLGKRMLYYGLEMDPPDWKNYGKYYVLYFDKALTHPDYYINNVTWLLFQHVENVQILEYALNVMEYDIKTWDQTPQAMDTYANLLHKLKKSNEAIKWEEKALYLKKGAPDEKLFAETLQKMKSGQPTWPTNN
jgi:hypothetical protein